MAKPNYAFEKRQKELAKKQKKQEKLLQRKSGENHEAESDAVDSELEIGSDGIESTDTASTPN